MNVDLIKTAVIVLILLLGLWRLLRKGNTKRQKIIITSTLVTFGLVSTQLINFDLRFKFLLLLTLFSFILTTWALWDGLKDISTSSKRFKFSLRKTKALILLILPTLFTLAVASFYFLLPVRWLTRIPVAIGFGLTFYLLLLAQNIFNVAAIRTIPLYRAASTLSFVCTILTVFLLFIVVHSFNLLFIWNGLIVGGISFLLILQLLWSINMEERVTFTLVVQSFIGSLVVAELALALSFWPVNHIMYSIVLTSATYVLLGIVTQHLRTKLTSRLAMEYVGVGVFFLIVAFLTTSWTG